MSEPQWRTYCGTCLQPEGHCYCAQIKRFDPRIEFAILIHPIEQRRRIATGRMSHLCLEHSLLIPGSDYSEDARVNALIRDPAKYPVILYPGKNSSNVGVLSEHERSALFPSDKKLVIFVIDGTWNTARKTMHESQNLRGLPRFCFSPSKPSNFRVRKQPSPEYYSTIEAIHRTIELLGPGRGFDLRSHQQDTLLRAFDWMVEKQLSSYKTPILRRVDQK